MFALTLYGVSGGVTGYFVWHAINGDRGLKAKEAYRTEMRAISQTRQTLQNEYDRLARRIAMIGGDNVDREYLEEEVRRMLGYVHKSDVVIFATPPVIPAAARPGAALDVE